MPRTSYGDSKRSRVWTLLTALIKARGSSHCEQVVVKNVSITYRNWSSTEKPYLDVQATLTNLAELSGLSSEQVRESLTAHLEKHLGILEDKRSQKAGCNAANWQFGLQLWSTDLDENQREFEALWQSQKLGGHTLLQPASSNSGLIDALVEVDYELGDTCSSLEQLKELARDLAKEPKNPDLASRAYYQIGRHSERAGDFNKAIEAFREMSKYLQKNEEKVETLGAISRCFLKLGNFEEAVDTLTSELRNFEESEKYKLYEHLADVYQEIEEPKLRAIALEKSISRREKKTELRSNTKLIRSSIE